MLCCNRVVCVCVFITTEPYSEYKISVKAFTWKNEGEASESVTQRTDISGPSAPIVVNLTCHNLDALYLRWKRPLEYYNSIDFYIVSFRVLEQHEFQEIKINASASTHLETAVSISSNVPILSIHSSRVNLNCRNNRKSILHLCLRLHVCLGTLAILNADGHTESNDKLLLWGESESCLDQHNQSTTNYTWLVLGTEEGKRARTYNFHVFCMHVEWFYFKWLRWFAAGYDWISSGSK